MMAGKHVHVMQLNNLREKFDDQTQSAFMTSSKDDHT